MSLKPLLGVAFVAALAFNAQSAYAVPLIVNGSFEQPTQAPGTWDIYANIPGWTGGDGGIEVRNNVAGTAYDGSNFIELDTNFNSLATQTIPTIASLVYKLTFAYAPRENVSADSNPIEVFWNSTLLATLTGTNPIWTLYTYYVTGTGSDVLKFAASGISDSYGGSLDAVSLVATPLPAAGMLFGSALVGFGLLGRRRRRLASVASAA